MRVLVIENDAATLQSIELLLKAENFSVYGTDSGEEGLDLGKLYDYDIILLSTNMPDLPGTDVLRNLRVAQVRTPIIMLSIDNAVDHKVRALGAGADDYVTKPFHKEELIARMYAVIRRSRGFARSSIEYGDLKILLDDKVATWKGTPIHLTGKEYGMLELLALRNMTVTKEMFLNHLYGGMDEPELKIIDVFICKLRKKLMNATGVNYVETVWGRGYRLVRPDEIEPEAVAS